MRVVRVAFFTPEIQDELFLSFLYPLARDGWLDPLRAKELSIDSFPWYPKPRRGVTDSTLLGKRLEAEAAESAFRDSRSEPFVSARRTRAGSSAPRIESRKPEVPGRIIGLWFTDRPKLRAFLEGVSPETRRGLEAMIWQDPRFRRVRDHVAKQEDVLFYFSEIISLNRRQQARLQQLRPSQKRERIERLLLREHRLSNGVLAAISRSAGNPS